MLRIPTTIVAASLIVAIAGSPSFAVLSFNDNVTPDVIFGSGNANGGFTVDRMNGIELGLRGKLRFDANNQAQNIFNSDGAGKYYFSTGTPNLAGPNLPSWATTTTPIWSWDWSINTDYAGTSGVNLAALDYRMDIDFDSSTNTTMVLSFDPINTLPAVPDHAIGTNATVNGGGATAGGNAATYTLLITTNNVAQNSWNMEFFNAPASPFAFDPNAIGEYTIRLSALEKITGNVLASVSIDVVAVPEGRAWMGGLLICGVVGAAWSIRRIIGSQPA